MHRGDPYEPIFSNTAKAYTTTLARKHIPVTAVAPLTNVRHIAPSA
jgi:hypothetical protein